MTLRLLASGDTLSASPDPDARTVTLAALSGDQDVTVTMTALEAVRFAQRLSMGASPLLTADEQARFLVEGLNLAAALITEAASADLDLTCSTSGPLTTCHGRVADLMAALEESVRDAKAARKAAP